MNLYSRLSRIEKTLRQVANGPCNYCGSKPSRQEKPSLLFGYCHEVYQPRPGLSHNDPMQDFVQELDDEQRAVLVRGAIQDASCPRCKRLPSDGDLMADSFRVEMERLDSLTPEQHQQEQVDRLDRLRARLAATS